MYFKKIELQGFKSFADPVTIEFQDGITCIVGPNGSGKSNLSDALRWVLGEQSPKMLRGGKMEEVIFAGTEHRKSRGMAEVTLTIDNHTQFLPIAYEEVAITRRMYRSGESEYAINKIPCRLRDIRELIMDTGIGVDGYSIIGQGKIAEVISNKAESRREIFEEAAGIVKYRTKKAEAERKLESGRLNLERVEDIISEIEMRLGQLETDSTKAKTYLDLKERYKTVEINVILKQLDDVELKNEQLKDDIMELEIEIEAVQCQRTELLQEMEDLKERSRALEVLLEKKRERLLACDAEKNQFSARQLVRKERMASAEKEQLRIASEMEELREKLLREKQNSEALQVAKTETAQEALDANRELQGYTANYESQAETLRQAAAALEEGRNQIYQLNALVSSKRGEMNSLKSMNEVLQRRREKIEQEQSDSEFAQQDVNALYEAACEKQTAAQETLVQLEEKRTIQKKSREEAAQERGELAKRLEEIRLERGRLEARKKVIEEMEHAYEGYSRGVRFIMNSDVPGLLGTVADLIRVPRGYELAVETALGAMVQNIVCRDEACAREAISLLKREKAGRLTFLPVSGIRPGGGKKDRSLLNEAGVCGYGTDCIEFDAAYRNVMEYLLGRVVIVDCLDSAIRLSKQKGIPGLRFVTLEGEVINAGGAITGGTVKTASTGVLGRKAEAARLQEQTDALYTQQQNEQNRLQELDQTLQSMKAEEEALFQEHRTAELELLSCKNEVAALAMKKREAVNANEKFERELVSIQEEGLSAAGMIEALNQEATAAEAKIAGLERDAEEKTVAYEQASNRIEALKETLAALRLRAGEAEAKRESTEQLLRRISDSLLEREQELSVRAARQTELQKLLQELAADDGTLSEQIAACEKEQRELESAMRLAQDEQTHLRMQLAESEVQKTGLDGQLQGHRERSHEYELRQTKLEMQIESYKEKLWDEFEISYVQAIEHQKHNFVMAEAVKESRELKRQMKALGDVNVAAIQEFETVKERYHFLDGQRTDLRQAMDELVRIINDMDRTIRRNFKESFDQIAENFHETFQQLFGGGTAELSLEDGSNPLECGIEIAAQPPGKKLQNINLMSGGEKTMTAIALMFAVLKAKPTPFCILDEIEAALDEVNVERVAKYLHDFSSIQFVLITHQKATMEYANALYGVTMPERGISKVISLRLSDQIKQ